MARIIILFCGLLFFGLYQEVEAERIRTIRPAPKPVLSEQDLTRIEMQETRRHRDGEGNDGMPETADFFDEMSYVYTGGRYEASEIRFRLRRPDHVLPGRRYPLIVWFHGNGEGGDDNLRQLAHVHYGIRSIAGPASRDFYLLATQTPSDNKAWRRHVSREDEKGDSGVTVLREIMEALIEEFPIDERRIGVCGVSSGGEAAWYFASETPERFAAMVSCSAEPPGSESLLGPNVWAFACTGDRRVSFEKVRDMIDEINREGGSASLTPVESNEHDSWTEALRNKQVLIWLASQRRGSSLAPPPGFGMKSRSVVQALFLFGSPVSCLIVVLLLKRRYHK